MQVLRHSPARIGVIVGGLVAMVALLLRIILQGANPDDLTLNLLDVAASLGAVAVGMVTYFWFRDRAAGISLTPLIGGVVTGIVASLVAILLAATAEQAVLVQTLNTLATLGAVTAATMVYLWLRDRALAIGQHPLRTLLLALTAAYLVRLLFIVLAVNSSTNGLAAAFRDLADFGALAAGLLVYFGARDRASDVSLTPLAAGLGAAVAVLLLAIVFAAVFGALLYDVPLGDPLPRAAEGLADAFGLVGRFGAIAIGLGAYFVVRSSMVGTGIFHLLVNESEFVLTPLLGWFRGESMGYFFVLPNLLIFSIFILMPMLLNFYYGFTSGGSILPQNREFVGTENLEELFNCEDFTNPNTCQHDRFWRAVSNTTVFVVAQVGIMVVFALLTALALNRQIVGRGFFRSVFFYPVLLSPVVVALIWKWTLQPEGVFNGILVGMGADRLPFLTDSNWAKLWVILVSVWAQMGFHMLILLAGLQSIPKDLYEASGLDGAGPWRTFRSITLPLLMPTMVVVLVLSLIRAVQVFDQVFVLTTGGPGTATLFMVQYIFQTAFDRLDFGLAAAASLVLAVVLLVLTLGQLRLGRTSEIA